MAHNKVWHALSEGDVHRRIQLEMEMKLTLNGKPHELRSSGSITALIKELGATAAHTAIMVNGEVVPAEEWETTELNENDEVEMLVFVGGG